MTLHTIAALGGALVAFELTSTPWRPTTQSSELSARLERAASSPPLPFAMMLAHAGVPSGVVLGESEYRSPSGGRPDLNLPSGSVTSVEALAKAFNASHSAHRAVVLGDVLVIHRGTQLPELLRQRSGSGKGEVIGAMQAVRLAWSGVDSTLGPSGGGVLGSAISRDPEDRPESMRVVFDGSESRVVDALNAISRQTRRAWLVVVSDDPTSSAAQIGLINRGGSSSMVPLRLRKN